MELVSYPWVVRGEKREKMVGEEEEEIHKQEIKRAAESLRNGKATGLDEIPGGSMEI